MRLKFGDLFEGLGCETLNFGPGCAAFSGKEVEIQGYLSPAHDGSGSVLLVNEPGACPDCSVAPVASIRLSGFSIPKNLKAETPVKMHGTLSYGLMIDKQSNASFLRLEGARIATGLPL